MLLRAPSGTGKLMNALVVYDSAYGNTEKVARAIGSALGSGTKVLRASEVSSADLEDIDILVIGSPTQGGRALPRVQQFLERLPDTHAKAMRYAAFDTRMAGRFVRIFGCAADKIDADLKAKGCVPIKPPEGFFVRGRTGPLREGELERASEWAKRLFD